MRDISQECGIAFKYAIVGLLNTVVGYGIFLISFFHFGFSANIANAIGYGIALLMAFLLNTIFVFNSGRINVKHCMKFLVAFIVSFGLNQFVLWALVYSGFLIPEVSQVFAMITYTVLFYVFNRFLVFH